MQPDRLHRRHDHFRKSVGWRCFLLAVMDAETAAHVQILDLVPLLPQSLNESDAFFDTLSVRLCRDDRRPQMHVQADDVNIAIAGEALGHFQNAVDVEAELGALDAGIGFDVRLGRQGRIDAQRHVGSLMGFFRDRGKRL